MSLTQSKALQFRLFLINLDIYGVRCSSVVDHLLMVQWIVGLIPHSGPIQLSLVPAKCCGKSIHSWCNGSLDQSFMVDPLSYFSFQPVLHDWHNKGMVQIKLKDPLQLIRKSRPCIDASRFQFSLSERSFTI